MAWTNSISKKTDPKGSAMVIISFFMSPHIYHHMALEFCCNPPNPDSCHTIHAHRDASTRRSTTVADFGHGTLATLMYVIVSVT
jgi:hypothetical protein